MHPILIFGLLGITTLQSRPHSDERFLTLDIVSIACERPEKVAYQHNDLRTESIYSRIDSSMSSTKSWKRAFGGLDA